MTIDVIEEYDEEEEEEEEEEETSSMPECEDTFSEHSVGSNCSQPFYYPKQTFQHVFEKFQQGNKKK